MNETRELTEAVAEWGAASEAEMTALAGWISGTVSTEALEAARERFARATRRKTRAWVAVSR